MISAVVDLGGKHLVTSTTYDGAGRSKNVIAPPADPNAAAPDPNGASNVTTYTYDADSNVTDTQVTNSRVSTTGNVVNETTVGYDALGRATQKVEQAQVQAPTAEPQVAQTTSFQYDKDGRTTQTTDASGTTTASYDGVGRVVGVLHPGSTQPDTSSYDLGNRVTTTTNSAGTTKTYYDALWRVVKEEHYDTNGTLVSTTSHAYDANGNELNPVTTPANGTQSGVTYTYDPLGRVSSVSDNARTYTYDASGQIGTMTAYSDPAKTTMAYQASFGYDAGTRTNTLTDKVGPSGVTLHHYSYGYDTANNWTAVTEDGTTTKYVYDDLNELTKVTDATGTTTLASYTYDANHNRATMMTSAGGTTVYTYDASGDVELVQKQDPNGKITTYTYDNSGNLTRAVYDPVPGTNQITSYAYNGTGRLSSVTKPDGTTISFSYDAGGNRLTKTLVTSGPVPTTTTIKDVYQAGRLASETDGAGTMLASFIYDANGVPASVTVGTDPNNATARYYYVYNPHGDVVALVNASGSPVATYAYDPFGVLTSVSESFTNGWSNPYRYDGADRVRYDVETGLYWMSTRAYDPTLGRFLARDPLGRTPMIWVTQPYVYGGNNPLSNVDPTGRRYYAPMGGDPNYDPVHNVTAVPDSHVLAVHKNGATVGQGKKLAPASPFDEGNVADTYEWGNAENYVIGKRFWGNALDAIIQAAQMMLHEKQSNTGGTFLRNSALKLFSLLVAGAIGGVLGFMAAGATGAAIGGGGGAAASFIAGAWVDYMTNVEIEQLQKTIADLQAVQSGGYQVWYLFGSYHGAYSAHSQILGSDDFEYGLGDSPSAVLLKVGEILEQDCADGSVKAIQWGNSPGLTPSQDTSYTPPPECGI